MSECPECGHRMMWVGGIMPSVCIWKAHDPYGHQKAVDGRRWAVQEERTQAVSFLRALARKIGILRSVEATAQAHALEEASAALERGDHVR